MTVTPDTPAAGKLKELQRLLQAIHTIAQQQPERIDEFQAQLQPLAAPSTSEQPDGDTGGTADVLASLRPLAEAQAELAAQLAHMAEAGQSPELAEVLARLSAIEIGQDQLIAQLAAFADLPAHLATLSHQTQIFDQLSAEVQGYRRNQQQEVQRQLLRELVDCYHQIEIVIRQRQDIAAEDEREAFEGVKDMISAALQRRNVYPLGEDQLLERKWVRVVGTRPTNQPERDQQIHHVYRQGFFHEDHLLCRAEIVVYRYVAEAQEAHNGG